MEHKSVNAIKCDNKYSLIRSKSNYLVRVLKRCINTKEFYAASKNNEVGLYQSAKTSNVSQCV